MKKQFLLYIFAIVYTLAVHGQIPSESVGYFGGSFNLSPTGGATYTVPIEIPQSVSGFQPSLSIVYNSQSGNGLVGWGCNIGGISVITRGPKDIYHDGVAKGMTYMADDAYYLDGQRMILTSGTAGKDRSVYQLETNPNVKIEVSGVFSGDNNSEAYFTVRKPDGSFDVYGWLDGARLKSISENGSKTYAWYLQYSYDGLGNAINYYYTLSYEP